MQLKQISATTQVLLGNADPNNAGQITFITSGMTANCKAIPKLRPEGTGTADLIAVPYTNLGTGTSIAAGTAITADGAYQVSSAGPEVLLDATYTSGTAATVWYWITNGGSGSGGGGGGGAVTIANGADTALGSTTDAAQIDYTQTATLIALTKGISEVLQGTGAGAVVPVKQQDASGNVQPAGDVAGRALFVQAQGEIADASSATGISSVIIGGTDASGLARTASNILLSSAPTSTSQYGLATYSQVAAVGNANTVHPIGSGQNLGDAGNGSNYLAVVEGQWNEVTFDRRRGNTQIQLLSSAVHTTATSADQINYNGRALHMVVNITAGAGSVTIALNGKEIGGTTYYPIIPTSSGLSGVTQTVFRVGQGLTAGTTTFNDFIPRTFNVVYTVTGTLTFSIGYNLLS